MSTPITEYVSVVVAVSDRLIQIQGFGTPLIFSLETLPAGWDAGQRIESYTSLAGILVDWPVTSLPYKAAQALFTGERAPALVKVGIELAADSGSQSTALDAIVAADPDFYGIIGTHRLEADANAIAAWVSSAATNHIYMLATEDTGVPDSGDDTDVASDFKSLGYNRSSCFYHHNGGINPTITTLTVSDLRTVTAAATAHGLRVGDAITIAAATDFGSDADVLNGNFTVATVASADAFTYTLAEDSTNGLATGTITCAGRYLFPEARWMGHMLPSTVGAEDWAYKPLTGQEPTPLSLLTLVQQQTVRGKNGNVYTTIGGIGATQLGKMGSGRFIDVQVDIDWLEARLGEAIMQRRISSPKIPYTQAGINSLIPDLVGVIEQAERNGMLGVIATSTSGEIHQIVMPQLADISATDKGNRNLPAATVTVQLAGSIITFNIDVAALL